jgi:hypothetical protein
VISLARSGAGDSISGASIQEVATILSQGQTVSAPMRVGSIPVFFFSFFDRI